MKWIDDNTEYWFRERAPVIWKGEVVGYADEFNGESSHRFGLTNCITEETTFARWKPLETEHTKAFLDKIRSGWHADVEVNGITYEVYTLPAKHIRLQRVEHTPNPFSPFPE